VAAALARSQIEEIAVPHVQALQKAELGRRDWERLLQLCQLIPDDNDWQVNVAYDALTALSGALIAANGYRRRGLSSHRLDLQITVELLAFTHEGQATALDTIGDHLRRQRNRLKYDRVDVIAEAERDHILTALPSILAALEEAVFIAIGRPLPRHSWVPPT
jgi:hypothetical protein